MEANGKKLYLLLILLGLLQLSTANAQDAGVIQLLSPKNLSCGSTNTSIKVIVYNYGSTTISNIPVGISATGTSTFSLTDTMKKSIAASKQDTFTFTTSVNSSAGGSWKYKIWAAISGDKNHLNDTLAGIIAINSLPANPTGFGGSRCGVGPVTFKASSTTLGSRIYWYPDTTSGIPFAKGDSISANLYATKTYYAASSSGSGFDSLSTTFSGTSTKNKGNMFNVLPVHDMTVDSFDVDFATKVNDTVYVYYKTGTYSGYQTNASAWTFLGKHYVTPTKALAPARAVIGGLSLKAGTLYAFYITLKNTGTVTKLSFLAQKSSTDSAYNSDLTIYSGDELSSFFISNTSGYRWNGRIYYTVPGCLSGLVPITGTVNPIVKSLNLSQNKTSSGAFNKGTLTNPDQVCTNDTLKYDIGIPSNFSNTDYGSKWKVSISLQTAKGYATANYSVIYPSASTNGLISFFPQSSDGDSVYILTVTAINLVTGCDSIFTRDINIDPIIYPGFSVNNVCLGKLIVLNNTATSAGKLGFLWVFGDGSSVSGSNINYQYQIAGNYTITQIASNPGCTASASRPVTIYNAPFGANFSMGAPFRGQFNGGDYPNPDYICIGDTITYQVVPPKGLANSDYGSKWVINSVSLKTLSGSGPYIKDTATKFLGGGKGVTFSFHPTKNADSLYALKMDIKTLPGNCDSVITRYLQVSIRPVAGFSFINTCFGTPLTFNDTTTTPYFTTVSNWNWDFGDGDTSMMQNPMHSYAKPGTYTVKLNVSTGQGCGNTVSTTVQQYPLPDVKFGAVGECSGSNTKFVDSGSISTGTIKNWAWNFGDGSTSTQKSPAHAYTNPGTYTTNLVETSSFGCVENLTKSIDIQQTPVAGFNYKNACAGSLIYFSNTSKDPAGNPKYKWDFGTGIYTSTAVNPTNTFTNNANYNTRLVIISGNGCTDTFSEVVKPLPKPVVDISFLGACAGLPVYLTDTGTNDGNSLYSWKYGDKGTSQLSANSTSHKYASAGTYTVSLSVQNGSGCIDSSEANITISALPKADFITADVCFNKQPASFVNTSTGIGTLKYAWNLGDKSNINTNTNVTHTYPSAGTYTVQLIAINSAGCADTVSKPININPVPIILPWTQSEINNVVKFLPQDTTIGKFEWHFGDPANDSSSNKEPTFTYPSGKGKYQVKLFVTNLHGCVAERSDSLYVSSSGIDLQTNNLNQLQIFPNPFEGITHINYNIPVRSSLVITVYDLSGKRISELKNGMFEAGNYSDVFDASKYHCPDGTYILKMIVNGEVYMTRIENVR